LREPGIGRAKRYYPEQIVNLLQQIEVAIANGKTHSVACREAGITEQTYYRWRKKYGAAHIELDDLPRPDGGNCEEVLRRFAEAGVDVNALAVQFQDEWTISFVKSWDDLMTVISSKDRSLETAAALRRAG
jgi:transposase-like protein